MPCRISVVVPTYNRLAQLKRTVAALEQQTYPKENWQVIVVSDGSSDGTVEYMLSLHTSVALNVLVQEHQGVSAASNLGVSAADGEIVLLMDDDIVPAPQLVEEHARSHSEHGDMVVVIGPMATPSDFKMSPWVGWEQAMLEKQYRAMQSGQWAPSARQFYTGNASVRRRHILDAGGFDPLLRRAQDVDLGYRLTALGLEFIFNPDAIGYHYARRSFLAWFEIPYLYGSTDVLIAKQNGQIWLLPKIFEEWCKRHPLTRFITRLFLGHQVASDLLCKVLQVAAACAHSLGLVRPVQSAYSVIFNLRYYQGVADELGGRAEFLAAAVRCRASVPSMQRPALNRRLIE
jgi:glycosyltransferase involved in cell wall biosynthesis